MRFSELLTWSGFKDWISGPAAPDHHAIAREARTRAKAALPARERLSDSHIVAIGEGVPTPPNRLRPDVFSEARSTSGRWLNHAARTEQFLDRINPVNAAVDAFDNRGKRKEQSLFGEWGSAAGHMARALQPREECHALSVLLLGDRGLHLVHVQNSPDGLEVGPGSRYGWGVPRARVAWIRKRNGARHGTHEIGFDDGSWVSVYFPVAGWGTLVEALANLNGGSGGTTR
ncbi:hypothetical protein [Streptomyces sp. AS02]|uniref:hypothetical protein n=1 Tax=Streptomyces sp. AS02 TaxID=2938946 RepID=UPI0020219138|nr:hypothetical protein [Streptomyces sp. AS02]MCL8016827.1 hypothetical protein [Streptomyces sp. AS02]